MNYVKSKQSSSGENSNTYKRTILLNFKTQHNHYGLQCLGTSEDDCAQHMQIWPNHSKYESCELLSRHDKRANYF